MRKTRFTELVGIRLPVMQGGMQWLATAELAAAVSSAGGLGTISAMSFQTGEALRQEIRKLRRYTDCPFAVNLSMLPSLGADERLLELTDVIVQEEVPVVETSGRSPEAILPRLKRANIIVLHKVTALRFAQKAERLGVDAVIAAGASCGGHPGLDGLPTALLVQRMVECLRIPVLAAGGIHDGRSMAAAFAWGASGVTMGTRFLATAECKLHPALKQWMLEAGELDTLLVQRSIGNPVRVLKNSHAQKVLELEKCAPTLEELMPYISGALGREMIETGSLEKGLLAMGQCVGSIHTIPPVAELLQSMEVEFQRTAAALSELAGC